MKKLLIALFVGSLSTSAALAEKDKGENAKAITASGKVICAHCNLKVGKSCQKAIQTAKGEAYILTGAEVTKFFKAEKTKKATHVKVTGKQCGKEGKHAILSTSKIETAAAKKTSS